MKPNVLSGGKPDLCKRITQRYPQYPRHISFPPTHDKTSDTFRGKNMKNMTNTGRHMTGKKVKFDLLFHL